MDGGVELELEVAGLHVHQPSGSSVLLLKEVSGTKVLPIWIGNSEAAAIMAVMDHEEALRPSAYDLTTKMLQVFRHEVVGLIVETMQDGVYRAKLEVDKETFDCRPSDGVVLALLNNVPIRCPKELMDKVGVETSAKPEDEMKEFKKFLDEVSPQDFFKD